MMAPRPRLSRRGLIAFAAVGGIGSDAARAGSRPAFDPTWSRLAAEQAAWTEWRDALARASRAEAAVFAFDGDDEDAADVLDGTAFNTRAVADASEVRHAATRAALYATVPGSIDAAAAVVERIVERESDLHGVTDEVMPALSNVGAALRRHYLI